MKDSLQLPVIFLGLLFACIIAFALGYLMYLWDIQYVPASPPTVNWALSAAPTAVRVVFVPATIVTIFLVIMRVARKPGIPILSFLLTLLVAGSGLFFGIGNLNQILGRPDTTINRSFNPISSNHFNTTATGMIYPQEVNGNGLGPTLVVVPSKSPSFAIEPKGSFDPRTWSVAFPADRQVIPISPKNPNFSSELAPRGFLAALFSDMAALDDFLERAHMSSLADFGIALGGVLLFSVSCMGFAWLTKWPVVNVVLVTVGFRALFWLYSLFSTQVARDAFALVVPKQFLPVAPAFGLGALAVILLIWNILFIRPPARE